MSEVGVFAALLAGLLSFLSPCVLPLIPGYLSFISGYGLAEVREGSGRFRILTRTLAFALGFTLVFSAMGILFSGASILLGSLSRTVTLIAGCLVIVLGVNLLFDFIKVLDLEARFHVKRSPRGYAGAFLLGVAFAAGWTPCVGPILASILLYASSNGDVPKAALLLAAYSAGLALPFFAAGLFFDALGPLMDWFKRHARGVRLASGALLIALGAGMALGRLGAINSAAARAGAALSRASADRPELAHLAAAAAWALIAALALSIPALRRKKAITPARTVFAAACTILALGEILGLWSAAAGLSRWLLFQGA
jgi:cytochrome c-type biogenesis protein